MEPSSSSSITTDHTSCYRAFSILKILTLILDNLTDDKRSLFHLACCSRLLSGPTLDYLWADLNSIAPFVPLLPNAVQETLGLTSNHSERERRSRRTAPLLLTDTTPKVSASEQRIRFERPSLEEWKTFDAYAYRVRHLRPDYRNRTLYPNLVLAIRPGVDLFPRLLSLQIDPPNDLELGMKFFPSSLRSLTMNYPDRLPRRLGGGEIAVRQAALDAPLLEKFHFVGIYLPFLGEESPPLHLERLHTLHLDVTFLRAADFGRLWNLFCTSPIRTLIFSLHCPVLVPDPQETHATPAFPNLETITINNGPLRAAAIVSQISSPHLSSVIIDSQDRSVKVEEYEQLFSLLSQRHPPIHSLRVRMGCFFAVYPDLLRRFLAALELLVQSGLRRLRLDLPLQSTCRSDENITRMLGADAWPTLEYFEFVQLTPLLFW